MLENVGDCLEFELVCRPECESRFAVVEVDLRVASLEVEPLEKILHCLIDRVLYFGHVHLRDDVE